MTIIVSALCEDGVVFGADEAMTTSVPGGPTVAQHPTDKIRVLHEDNAGFLHTGELGAGQRIAAALEAKVKKTPGLHKKTPTEIEAMVRQELQQVPDPLTDLAAKLVEQARVPMNPAPLVEMSKRRLGGGFVIMPSDEGPMVVAFEGYDAIWRLEQGKMHWAVAGSGTLTGDPFMEFVARVAWGGEIPPVEQCQIGVYWALLHAIKTGAPGVGGHPAIATMLPRGNKGHQKCERLGDAELGEIVAKVESLEGSIFHHLHGRVQGPQEDIPEPPAD